MFVIRIVSGADRERPAPVILLPVGTDSAAPHRQVCPLAHRAGAHDVCCLGSIWTYPRTTHLVRRRARRTSYRRRCAAHQVSFLTRGSRGFAPCHCCAMPVLLKGSDVEASWNAEPGALSRRRTGKRHSLTQAQAGGRPAVAVITGFRRKASARSRAFRLPAPVVVGEGGRRAAFACASVTIESQ